MKPSNPQRQGNDLLILTVILFLTASSLFIFSYQTFWAHKQDPLVGSRQQPNSIEKSTTVEEKDLATDLLIKKTGRVGVDTENSTNALLTEKFSAASFFKTHKREEPLVAYQGPLEHIFFHPLIAYPELAFDNDQHAQGYNEWFITVNEFNKILDSLYKKGFILVDINYLYDIKVENGKNTLVKKDNILLPKGKKPLVISIDDLNYYNYMIENGNVHKLVLDEHGNIATLTNLPSGEKYIAYNNEIVPILDEFVADHPDFSFKNAKGIIALTGYQGILGYRLIKNSPTYEAEEAVALAVVKRLKETGWSFASHGYGHLNARDATYSNFVRDTSKWKNEVEPFIGPTNVYIYPFGSSLVPGDPKFQYLLDSGFNVLAGVGPNPYWKVAPDYILTDRLHIDGIALFYQGNMLTDFFNSEEIIDPVRPPLPLLEQKTQKK